MECPVCGRDVKVSLRKHAAGKWLSNFEDNKHLKLAIELTPGAPAFLEDIYFKEGGSGEKDRHDLPIVRGFVHHDG